MLNSTFAIRASIAVMVLTIAAISSPSAKANGDASTPASPPVVGLTTLVDFTKTKPESNPGWIQVSDRNGKSACLQNLDTHRVLCADLGLGRQQVVQTQ